VNKLVPVTSLLWAL